MLLYILLHEIPPLLMLSRISVGTTTFLILFLLKLYRAEWWIKKDIGPSWSVLRHEGPDKPQEVPLSNLSQAPSILSLYWSLLSRDRC